MRCPRRGPGRCRRLRGTIDQLRRTTTVRTAPELYAALATATRGQRIHAIRGVYDLDRALVVPDGVALIGDGEMQADAAGIPQRWATETTTLRVSEQLLANVVTLGDDTALEGLKIVQIANESSPQSARPRPAALEAPSWNVVAIVSRKPETASPQRYAIARS